ncbi:ADP-ribose pyrophosphatase [Seinonella peptonophila]|uniref:ADP-ribose pyrophosphatase n=1 Tax=Seinonella peptonophila TaxID=112248 RepID=A0A1M4TKP3_9BACL|nr:NUDIX hydrolase [Seinonella peptonophila]SHE44965.1 ADP-ribose pyrophosphatase [Seinonella peptonophila]
MTQFQEKTISRKLIFRGCIVELYVDQVQLPNGSYSTREVIKHPGAVAVIAITPENRLVLVRQFRKALEKTILEIPAGKLEQDEKPEACALRELEEETGYRASKLYHLTSFYTSPGFADEFLHIYVAEGLEKGEQQPDVDEFVELVEYDLETCLEQMQLGLICDAKTVAAIYYWQLQRK